MDADLGIGGITTICIRTQPGTIQRKSCSYKPHKFVALFANVRYDNGFKKMLIRRTMLLTMELLTLIGQ